jgi:hypothetical protein
MLLYHIQIERDFFTGRIIQKKMDLVDILRSHSASDYTDSTAESRRSVGE